MLTQDEAFLQAILEQPDDDTPRLIYADWLEEQGDPRGEFIRIQCALAGLPPDDARRPELGAREAALLESHREAWLEPLRGLGSGALPSLWDRLEHIAHPTLLVVGELDEKFVATAERMARVMPRARVAVIPTVGHTVHLEAPAAWLDAVVGFLRGAR